MRGPASLRGPAAGEWMVVCPSRSGSPRTTSSRRRLRTRPSTGTRRTEAAGDRLRLGIRDDGVGGADFGDGSGLVGLKDRVGALGVRITLQSEPAAGTSLEVELPLTESVGAPH